MEFLKWYKRTIESGSESPPNSVWEEIQDELDVDIVWKNINNNLGKDRSKISVYIRYAAAASVFIAIGLGTLLYTIYKPLDSTSDYLSDKATIEDVRDASTVSPGKETPQQHAQYTIKQDPEDEIQVKTDFQQESLLIAEKEVKIEPQHIEPDHQIELPITASLPGISNYIDPIPALAEADTVPPILLAQTELAIKERGSYYIGVSGHAANTWLVNNKTLQGLKSEDLVASLPSFGYNMGIIAGRDFNNKYGLQLELFLISQHGQNYNEYIHGHYVTNSLQLNYTNISTFGKWQFHKSDNYGSNSVLFGAYFSYLKTADQIIDGIQSSLTNEYKSIDYGVAASYEYGYPISNKLTLGTGVHLRYGLTNIFAGNELIPDYLNSTRNLSVNFMLSIKYNLK